MITPTEPEEFFRRTARAIWSMIRDVCRFVLGPALVGLLRSLWRGGWLGGVVVVILTAAIDCRNQAPGLGKCDLTSLFHGLEAVILYVSALFLYQLLVAPVRIIRGLRSERARQEEVVRGLRMLEVTVNRGRLAEQRIADQISNGRALMDLIEGEAAGWPDRLTGWSRDVQQTLIGNLWDYAAEFPPLPDRFEVPLAEAVGIVAERCQRLQALVDLLAEQWRP